MGQSSGLRTVILVAIGLEVAVIIAGIFALALGSAGADSIGAAEAGPLATSQDDASRFVQGGWAEPTASVSASSFVYESWNEPTARPTRRPTSTLPPTRIPSPTPSPTQTPTSTPTPVPTMTPTPTPVPTATPRPVFPTATPLTPTPVPWPQGPTPQPSLPAYVEVPILYYHHVEDLGHDADEVLRELTVWPSTFESQLQYLSDNGYHTVTLDDLYHSLVDGQPLPVKPVILTFDDGYRDAYDIVFPLLRRHSFSGTFFILSGRVDAEDPAYLSWAMIEEMSKAGMDIQAHGREHEVVAGLPYEFLLSETQGVKETLESHLGKPVHFFCYPYGVYDANAIAVLESLGYWGAVATRDGRYHSPADLFDLPRIRISRDDSLAGFADKVEGR